MTEKQKRFADEYLIDLNATRAYRAAYPNCKSDKAAAAAATRLLKNVKVQKYIEEKSKEIHREKIADAQEVMEYLTAVMRRENMESVVVTLTEEQTKYITGKDGVARRQTVKKEVPQIVEIPAKLSDANKAAELLGKRFQLFKEGIDLNVQIPIFEGESELEE